MALFNKEVKRTPFHVTSSGLVNPRSTNGVNAIALVNSSKRPMEINQIKWSMTIDNYTIYGGIGAGVGLGCKFDLGKIALTNGYVPTYSFGKRESFGENLSIAATAALAAQNLNQGVWNLARPLYIPPGAALVPSFEHRMQGTTGINVRLSYAGSLLPVGYRPKKLSLPYVSAYSSKVMVAEDADTDSSSETDLLNPFNTPLFIERFTGRVSVFYNPTPGTFIATDINVADAFLSESMTVKMHDSVGHWIVRDPAIFGQVFSAVSRSWEGRDASLEPNSYILVDLAKAARTDVGTGTYSVQATIGLVGWREMSGGLEIA